MFQELYLILYNIFDLCLSEDIELGLPLNPYIIGFTVYAVLRVVGMYLFLSFGLYVMAKRRGMDKAWLAFVPGADVWLVCRLGADDGRPRNWLAILSVVVFVLFLAVEILTDVVNIIPCLAVIGGYADNNAIEAFSKAGEEFLPLLEATDIIYPLVLFIMRALWTADLFFLFRSYAPRSHRLFSVIAFLFPFVSTIIVFCIRKNSSAQYRNFMRMKMHAMYGGGNPYQYDDGTYSDPFDLSGEGKKGEEPPESPFGEYDDKK